MLVSCSYKKSRISLIGDFFNTKENIFSVLVGVNGVGKSRLLSGIAMNAANITKQTNSIKQERISDVSNNLNPEYSKEFSCVIASSVSPFDKFPIVKGSEKDTGIYKYIGIRGIGAENIGFSHMSRVVVDLIDKSRNDSSVFKTISNTLNYLGYSDNLNFEFKLSLDFIGLGDSLLNMKNENLFNDVFKSSDFINEALDSLNDRIDEIQRKIKSLENQKMKLASKEENTWLGDIGYFYHIISSIKNFGFDNLSTFIRLHQKFKNIQSFNIQIIKGKLIFSDKRISFDDLILGGDLGAINSNVFQFKKVRLRKTGQSRPINISSASSGEQSILISLLGISTYLENNSLVLIDEPEICLHPSWQEKYIGLISGCFSKFSGCQFIIATHSPQIISNLDVGNCYVVNMTDNETHTSDDFVKRSADFQLANLFHAPGHKNEYLIKKISLILAELSNGNKNIDTDEIEEIIKIQRFLPENDPVINLISVLKKALSVLK